MWRMWLLATYPDWGQLPRPLDRRLRSWYDAAIRIPGPRRASTASACQARVEKRSLDDTSQPTNRISAGLIRYLRAELGDAAICYQKPPTRMQGGYETRVYRFSLSGAWAELSRSLVLRLYPPSCDPARAVWESTVQNALAAENYPAPRAYLTCTDPSVLGGAFFVMECLPGELMIRAPYETIPDMLGRAQAALHRIDPRPVRRTLNEQGFHERDYSLGSRLKWLQESADRHRWLAEAVDWLIQRRPAEPQGLCICHGDFHPLNILVQDGQVSGVLDWPGLMIADPALDVANTMVLTEISAKHLLSLTEGDKALELYLAAYRAQNPLDLAHLDYYRARRCVAALVEGAEGHQVWRQGPIATDLADCIYQVTGIRPSPPW
jgi:aminoglycoside phosphotransferase (APT) family kinase protein